MQIKRLSRLNGTARILVVVFALLVQLIPTLGAELDMLPKEPGPGSDWRWLYLPAVITLVFAGVGGGIISYIYRINRRLKKNLARVQVLSTAVEQSPTSIMITGPDLVIQYVNPYFSIETGYLAEEVLGKTPRILSSGLTDPGAYQAMWASLSAGEPWVGEFVNRRKSGEVYWEEAHIAPVKNSNGQIDQYVAVKLNITERKRAHEQLAHLAFHDVLTGLPNRALFFEHVAKSIALARHNRTRLAVMYIDLDKFKAINDNHGHAVGDLVLREAASRMSGCLRASDIVGRIGGDEFVALLDNVGAEQHAVAIAEKIRAMIDQPFQVNGQTLSISSSIGIAIYPDHGHDDIELAAHADMAMYQAKTGGRDQVKVFEAALRGSPR